MGRLSIKKVRAKPGKPGKSRQQKLQSYRKHIKEIINSYQHNMIPTVEKDIIYIKSLAGLLLNRKRRKPRIERDSYIGIDCKTINGIDSDKLLTLYIGILQQEKSNKAMTQTSLKKISIFTTGDKSISQSPPLTLA